jgi:hypothetical protein
MLEGAADADGYFVARVRGEEAVRDAPHPMGEGDVDTGARVAEGMLLGAAREEGLGELPWGYLCDALVAMPRDPCSLFLYWDHAEATVQRALLGLLHPRIQLWLDVQGSGGWERDRVLECALESRSYYVHGLAPGRTYRAEIRVVDRAGANRQVGPCSGAVSLPPRGPSPVVDDRYLRLEPGMPLGPLLGPGRKGPAQSEEELLDRDALAELSSGQAGAAPDRPTSPSPGGGAGRPLAGGSGGGR